MKGRHRSRPFLSEMRVGAAVLAIGAAGLLLAGVVRRGGR